jgi:hypothetical protein
MEYLPNDLRVVMDRVEATLQTAKLGLDDLLDPSRARRMSGLRNLIAFGRSVTFVLQNLRSVAPDFDEWYGPHQDALKADPLMRYFVDARNELEKQGKLSVATSTRLHSFSGEDIRKLGRPPVGAKSFFMGDQLGGSGWEVELADGSVEKYYVELPLSLVEVRQQFSNLPEALAPELKGASIEELSQRYIDRLTALVNEAKAHFLGQRNVASEKKSPPPYLRRVK